MHAMPWMFCGATKFKFGAYYCGYATGKRAGTMKGWRDGGMDVKVETN